MKPKSTNAYETAHQRLLDLVAASMLAYKAKNEAAEKTPEALEYAKIKAQVKEAYMARESAIKAA